MANFPGQGFMKARAVITDGKDGFFVDEIAVAEPAGEEVLVELRASGVCHTDWDVKRNAKRHVVMGHEGAGVVLRTGPLVTDLKEGDRVALNWARPCGRCYQCARGNQNICENKAAARPESTTFRGEPIVRAFGLGTMATHTVVPRAACTRMEVEIPFASASILGCGVMTGVGSVLNAARVEPGSSVVVLGAGGVGLNCVQGARIAGAAMIIAVDVNPERLSMARKFGATHTLQAKREDEGLAASAEEVRKLTGGRGADYAFESTAVPQLGAAPLAMIRNGGTAVQASGIEQPISFNMELFEWDKVYINPLYGKCVPERDFPRLLKLYETRALMLDEMVTRTYALDELAAAFDDMLAGRNAKGVILL
jgi:S-(hydroxymethyl)glutathione dehydrogenase/alcohol dehydrogenase